LRRITFSPDGTLWVGSRDGVYFFNSNDKSWMAFSRFPLRGIDDVYYDAGLNKVLFSSRTSDHVYAIDPSTKAWQLFMAGYRLHLIRASNDHLVAASLYDGVLMGPKVDATTPSAK
jgi:outer membrane protein assembly factor BamB